MPLTIGIEASPLGYPAGGGLWSFLHYAVRELASLDRENRYVLYTTPGTTDAMLPEGVAQDPRWRVHSAAGISAVRPSLWLQAGFPRASARDHLDVFWVTRHVPPLAAPRLPLVATIFDLLYHYVPDTLSSSLRWTNELFVRATARRARRVIATSRATARDVVEVLGVDPARVVVAYGGVDHARFFPREPEVARTHVRQAYGVERPYVLALEVYVGRKNVATQLEAYRLLPADLRREFPLIATGRPARHVRNVDVPRIIRGLGLGRDVHLVDHVDHATMPLLYSGAALLAFASRYEGFGLPIVEAMACGCPVLTSDCFSMPEAGGEAAAYAPPDDPASLARQMERVLGSCEVAEEMRRTGLDQAKRFTWAAYTEAVLEALVAAGSERAR